MSHREGPLAGAVEHLIERKSEGIGDRRIEILNLHRILSHILTTLVGFPVSDAALETTAGEH